MDIYLENIRTFDGEHSISLRPITLLTGENSSGKSTLLGMIAATCDHENFPMNPTFDQSPYSLGSYDTIATYKGGRYGRAKSFGLGYTVGESGADDYDHRRATYVSRRGRVELSHFVAESAGGRLEVSFQREKGSLLGEVTVTTDEKVTAPFSVPRSMEEMAEGSIFAFLMAALGRDQSALGAGVPIMKGAMNVLFARGVQPVISVAPIRTRPERIYSRAVARFEPTGDHVPFLLDRLLTESRTSDDRKRVERALADFGRASGLFDQVSIRKRGNKSSDPFEVMVSVHGKPRNLVDVGYGVSQSLPIIVQTILESLARRILLQQPEVHLHPKAQAALGTFLCNMVGEGRSFVVETHSDYILDRIRQEVARGSVPADAVRILFFKRAGYETTIHPISLDSSGNVVGAPPSYRAFFLKEELELLRRGVD